MTFHNIRYPLHASAPVCCPLVAARRPAVPGQPSKLGHGQARPHMTRTVRPVLPLHHTSLAPQPRWPPNQSRSEEEAVERPTGPAGDQHAHPQSQRQRPQQQEQAGAGGLLVGCAGNGSGVDQGASVRDSLGRDALRGGSILALPETGSAAAAAVVVSGNGCGVAPVRDVLSSADGQRQAGVLNADSSLAAHTRNGATGGSACAGTAAHRAAPQTAVRDNGNGSGPLPCSTATQEQHLLYHAQPGDVSSCADISSTTSCRSDNSSGTSSSTAFAPPAVVEAAVVPTQLHSASDEHSASIPEADTSGHSVPMQPGLLPPEASAGAAAPTAADVTASRSRAAASQLLVVTDPAFVQARQSAVGAAESYGGTRYVAPGPEAPALEEEVGAPEGVLLDDATRGQGFTATVHLAQPVSEAVQAAVQDPAAATPAKVSASM